MEHRPFAPRVSVATGVVSSYGASQQSQIYQLAAATWTQIAPPNPQRLNLIAVWDIANAANSSAYVAPGNGVASIFQLTLGQSNSLLAYGGVFVQTSAIWAWSSAGGKLHVNEWNTPL